MMHTLTYTSNRAGTVIDLADPEGIMCGQILELRTRTWEFELGYRSLQATRPRRPSRSPGSSTVSRRSKRPRNCSTRTCTPTSTMPRNPASSRWTDGHRPASWSATNLTTRHPCSCAAISRSPCLTGCGTNRSGRASAGRRPATTEARTIPTTIATITRRPATSAASTTNPPCPRG